MAPRPAAPTPWRTAAIPLPALPARWASLSPDALAGLYRATLRAPAATPSQRLRDDARLWEAVARDALSLDDTVRVGGRDDTVGRHLVARCLPPALRRAQVWAWGTAQRVLRRVNRTYGGEVTARCAGALEQLGRWVLARATPSLCGDDLAPAPETAGYAREALERAVEIQAVYDEALITDGERYNRLVDVWAHAVDRDRSHVRARTPDDGALAVLTQAGPALAAMRAMGGLQAKPSGEIIERPVLRSLAEGRSPHEAFLRWTATRHSVQTEDHPPRAVGEILHDLHVALGDLRVAALDCGARHGVTLEATWTEAGEVISLVGERALGRLLAEDVIARDGTLVAPRGALVTPAVASRVDAAHLPSLRVRDPQTCEASGGPCARCLGLDPADGTWPQPGDPLGPRVAYELTRACRLRPSRTFHIC